MSYFRKAVLNVGTYHSPDGLVEVTRERLKHWEQSVKQLQATGYAIPMHWDHADQASIDLLEPVRLSTLKEGKDRSARNTVGTLQSFVVTADGNGAELTVQTLTPSATEKAQSNAVYVSPVLFDYWKDGSGKTYADIIGSVDLVDYPVDHSQGPFEPVEPVRLSCAIRMSASPTKLYRMSENDQMEDEMTYMSQDGDGDEGAPALPPMQPQAQPTGARVADAIAGLAKMKIMLPDDTTPENFLDRLVPALMTAAAQTAPEEMPMEQLPPEPEPEPEKPVLVDNPQIAAMSLRLKKFEADKLSEGKKALANRLESLLASGRMTPAEHTEQVKRLGLTKMSLTDDATVKTTPIDIWVSAREAIPEGACWTPNMRLQQLSTIKKQNPPAAWNTKTPDIEEALTQKRQMLRRQI